MGIQDFIEARDRAAVEDAQYAALRSARQKIAEKMEAKRESAGHVEIQLRLTIAELRALHRSR